MTSFANATCCPPAPGASYCLEERRLLIRRAHQAIEESIKGNKLDMAAPSKHLAEPRGAFTTLHLHGQLRGCVGYVQAFHSVWRTVTETAIAAAFFDSRFYPVTDTEAPLIKVEISVLSPPATILPDEVEVGRHGLIVSHKNQRGLLLPQVPIEHGWERDMFLAQTCLKAGLAPDAWLHGAQLEAFTAEVFSEEEVFG